MLNQTTWLGKASSSWLDVSNWSKGIPSIGVHAYIPDNSTTLFHPIISSNLKMNFTLKNDGRVEIDAELYIQKNGIFQNYGLTKVSDIGTLNNEGNVINFGEWVNEGTCDNKRIFTNHYRMFNEGLFDNENTFVNIGTFVNTGVIDNHRSINNSGKLENFNILENHGFAEVSNKGFFPEEFIEEHEMTIPSREDILTKLTIE